MRIGIPRSLTYYWFYPFWKGFFNSLNIKLVISPPTNKNILDTGVKIAVDEACLPVKIYLGHVDFLLNKVDLLFIPSIKSTETKRYYCPNIIALPETVRAFFDKPILAPEINCYKDPNAWKKNYIRAAQKLGYSYPSAYKAMEKGHEEQKAFLNNIKLKYSGEESCDRSIALLGNPYLIEDGFVNFNIIRKLNSNGFAVKTPMQLPSEIVDLHTTMLEKDLFWNYPRYMIAAASYFSQNNLVDGFILLSSFGCGTNAIIEPYLFTLTKNFPLLILTFDEHTSTAGIDTRLEAFLDMVLFNKVRGQPV